MKKIYYSILILTLFFKGFSQDYHVRIGFIGNSITEGVGVNIPATEAYPIQVGNLLKEKYGDTCIVRNFGLTTTTMLKKGDVPYWNSPHFSNCLTFAPEICLIALGTNDTKPQNWDAHGSEYVGDYLAMIDSLKTRNPNMKFLVCYPPPAFEIKWGINDSIIVHGIIPGVDSVISATGAVLVDFHQPLLDSIALFPDHIHPNALGAKALARIVYKTMVESDIVHKADTGYTFVTSFKTDKPLIKIKDSVSISWTTINADSVKLDGKIVQVNSSLKISPVQTKTYWLHAYGDKNSDSVKLEQQVYIPALNSFKIYPDKKTLDQGDSLFIKIVYFDQKNARMRDTVVDVQWSITSGNGSFYNETDTTVIFIADSAGTTKITAVFDTISIASTITIKPSVSKVDKNSANKSIQVYPNPFGESFTIYVGENMGSLLSIQLYDLKGSLCRKERINLSKTDNQYTFKSDGLQSGTYIYEIEISGKQFKGIIEKR